MATISRRLWYWVGRAASRRVAVGVAVAVLPIALRLALLGWIPMPQPGIQDEFSYLLAADTYAHGRLTNPTHPMWIHFETVHEIMHPTYQSKYPPLQGMLLAVGQVLFHEPWAGVLLSIGAMNAALWWALNGWLPPRWALLATLLAVLRIGFVSYWTEGYWGGAAAAVGGALVIGAVPRLRRGFSFWIALIFASGLGMLANSRPFEGAILGAICLGAVLMRVSLGKMAGPLALVLVPVGVWMAYYNYRVTGDPLRFAYEEHERQYETWAPFVWDTHPRVAPQYNHEDLRATWIGWEEAKRRREGAAPLKTRLASFYLFENSYTGVPLTLCLLALAVPVWRSQRRVRLAVALSLLFTLAAQTETHVWPHYVAPATALVFVIVGAVMRQFRHCAPRAMLAVCAVIVLFDVYQLCTSDSRWLFDKSDFVAERRVVLSRLEKASGKQLVFVEYHPGHDVNHEWVYNRADIDASRIVWAHAMSPERDEELIRYYPDRNVWRFEDDAAGKFTLERVSPAARPKDTPR